MTINDNASLEAVARAIEISTANIDAIVHQYVETQLWVTRDEIYAVAVDLDGGSHYDNKEAMEATERVRAEVDNWEEHGENLDYFYSYDDVDSGYLAELREEIEGIVSAHCFLIRRYLKRNDSEQFGNDLLLTRDGHGAGFWDRGLDELGEALDKMAKALGSSRDLHDGYLSIPSANHVRGTLYAS